MSDVKWLGYLTSAQRGFGNSPTQKIEYLMDEFTQAVFEAAYQSRRQRSLRFLLTAALIVKHTLRGLFFSWPLYLLSLAGLALPGEFAWAFVLLLIPALVVSGYILSKGLREDYRAFVRDRLLKRKDLWRVMLGDGG